jgi:hypothetical protein
MTALILELAFFFFFFFSKRERGKIVTYGFVNGEDITFG